MIGILILTHEPLGQAFLATAKHVYKKAPDAVVAIDVQADEDIGLVVERAREAIAQLHQINEVAGVLVLTDVCGATPANCAVRLIEQEPDTELIYGVSLPVLLRAINYRNLPLNELVEKTIEGGQRGLFAYEDHDHPHAGKAGK